MVDLNENLPKIVLSTGLHFTNRKCKMPRLFFYKHYQKHLDTPLKPLDLYNLIL